MRRRSLLTGTAMAIAAPAIVRAQGAAAHAQSLLMSLSLITLNQRSCSFFW